MTFRFKIKNLLLVIAITALILAFIAPRIRSWDRQTRDLFLGTAMISGLFLASMIPVGIALVLRWRRSRLGLEIRPIDRGILFMSFIFGLILFLLTFPLLFVARR
jgi:hypothetical protein